MATRMLQRRGTAAEWAALNPILADGEIGFETDTKIIKVGDGVTAWNSLTTPYLSTQELTDHAGLTNPHSATNLATPNRLVLRDSNGRAQVADPGVAADVANKGWVESAIVAAAPELPTVKMKAADESLASSTTLQNDDDLFASLEANAKYTLKLFMHFTSPDSDSIGAKIQPSGPAGCVIKSFGIYGPQMDIANVQFYGGVMIGNGTVLNLMGQTSVAGDHLLWVEGVILNGATAGTLNIKWAQINSNAQAIVAKKGSFLALDKIP